MTILDKIINNKRQEVLLKKSIIPISQLENSVLFDNTTISLSNNLRTSTSGIIAEHKRRSPSKGEINYNLNIKEVVKGYQNAGASGISILTDGTYFGGSLDDLLLARALVKLPLLRKEFIIDEYQVIESKAFGADVILLIASILTQKEIKNLSELAQSLALEVLLEIHDEAELNKSLLPSLNMIGVNNRNLKTFEVDLEISTKLASKIPSDFVKVSESGIESIASIKNLQKFDYQGFLIGENFMKSTHFDTNVKEFISKLSL